MDRERAEGRDRAERVENQATQLSRNNSLLTASKLRPENRAERNKDRAEQHKSRAATSIPNYDQTRSQSCPS